MDPSQVLVLGAGPAGSAAARLLSLWGHRVTLVTRPAPPGGGALAESLTPSCGKVFDLLGIRDRIDAAAFVHGAGNTVWWGPDDARVEPFPEGTHGWQATTGTLETVMLAAAEDAGVAVERRRLTAEEAMAIPAAMRLDASGRAGLLARSLAGRRTEPGHETVALSAVWHRGTWPLPDSTHTLIESYADGWAWSVPIDAERRAVAVMVDPRSTDLARGAGARTTYLAELRKATRLAALVEPAALVSGPAGWDASLYHSTRYAGPGWMVVGDAASFVDPLSSAGVKKALASGWLAAIAAHTALTRPAMADAALGFFADREAEMYGHLLARTRRYLREAAEGQAHPFWAARAEAADRAEEQAAGRDEQARVREAWEGLRAAADLRVRRGAGVQVEPRAAIAGREIVLEPRLVTSDHPAGVRFVADVDVVTLVEIAPRYRQVPELYEACVRRSGPVALPAFLTALATALARGWLAPEA